MAVKTTRTASLCPGRGRPKKNAPNAADIWWNGGTGSYAPTLNVAIAWI